MRFVRLPGVYAPKGDTSLLLENVSDCVGRGTRVLDLGTGTGAVGIAAGRLGARVVAVDIARNAVWCARLNAAVHRVPVQVRRYADLDRLPKEAFDLVVANPPYVPSPAEAGLARGAARAWEGGADGREHLDPWCVRARELLAPGGELLIVHSALCGVDPTLEQLRSHALQAGVVARRWQPFGPVLGQRREWLENAGIIEPGQDGEELVVVRARKTAAAQEA